MIEDS